MSTLKDRLSPEEWKAYRSEVNKRYALTAKGKESIARKNRSPLAPDRYARYRQTEKYRAGQARYRASPLGAQTAADMMRRQKELFPERVAARAAIASALRRGDLRRPNACSCGATTQLDAHHHLGYEPEHWLDVQWLCRVCHKSAH